MAYVFCCFNLLYKIEPETFAIWMDILRQTAPSKKEGKGSVLWLLRHSSPVAAQKLRSRAEQYGVDPERIVLSDRFPSDEHLVVKSLCDAFLDTPMYNGHGAPCRGKREPICSLVLKNFIVAVLLFSLFLYIFFVLFWIRHLFDFCSSFLFSFSF